MNNDFKQKNNQETQNETSEKPLVSVNICAHNRADLISKTIESVFEQDYPNIEIIIADDGDDNTEEVIKGILEKNPEWKDKIHYYKNPNSGIAQNRNFALNRSNGDYIAVLDSDDYWISTDKISRQVQFLENNPEYKLIGTNAKIVNSEYESIGQIKNKKSHKEIFENSLLKDEFVHSSILFKKEAIPEYNEDNTTGSEDWDAFLKITRDKENKVANIPEFMTAYKKHSGNITHKNKIKAVLTLEKIIKENKDFYPNYYKARFKNLLRLLKAILPF